MKNPNNTTMDWCLVRQYGFKRRVFICVGLWYVGSESSVVAYVSFSPLFYRAVVDVTHLIYENPLILKMKDKGAW